MPTLIHKKLSFNNAEIFKKSVSEFNSTILYLYIGNHVPYVNESSPYSLEDTVATEKSIWDNIFAAKKVTGNDIQLVVPRVNWTANTRYRQYDDKTDVVTLLTANTSQNLKPMYIMTSQRNVYLCVSNNASANSTIEPTGDYTTSNGNIGTADGYVWKYLYNIKPSNKFVNTSWIPAPVSANALDYGINSTGIVEGELVSILVLNSGTNYRESSTIKVDGFVGGQTTLRLSNTANVLSVFSIPSLANLANMSISGIGLDQDTYISAISNITGTITLSTPSLSSGGSANTIKISTRVYIDGDGIGAKANVTISNTVFGVAESLANISKITVDTIGTDYTRANAYIFGSGSGANARVILPPKHGHAFNPAEQMIANNVMISMKIGELDSSEGGKISTDTSFRQFGILRDPYKYGSSVPVNSSTANSVISQTVNLDIVAGSPYTLNEFVYQGSINNPLAYGFVHAQTTNGVRLTNVKGKFVFGVPLVGATSGQSRTVTATSNPDFQPYSGDILYTENVTKIERTEGQAESIKLIINF